MTEPRDDQKVAVGISGLGRSGWNLHARTLHELPDRFRIAAVCDNISDRREQATAEFGARAYASFDELVNDEEVELLVVAVPSHAHADQAVQALRAGKHVLVEKPFATSLDQAKMMFEVAKKEERLLLGSQNMRFEAGFMKVREIIKSGRLGELIEIRTAWHRFRRRWDWQTLRQYGGGALANDGSHVIDQVLLLVDQDLPDVFCKLVHTPLSLGDAEDYAKIVLTGPGAPVVDLEFTDACAYPNDEWLVMGTQGSLAGGHGKYRARYFDPNLLAPREVSTDPTADRRYNTEELPWVEETVDVSTEEYRMSHRRLYIAIHEALRAGARSPVSPESLLRQLATIEACRSAADEIMEVGA